MYNSFLNVFSKNKSNKIPLWLMRQAGRYLPEYWEVRNKAKDFIDFCNRPELTIEATLQPIRRFDFDAAIIFSDILIIPSALNLNVKFIDQKGPIIEDFDIENYNCELNLSKLQPVYDSIREVRGILPPEKTLIGFAGAPWTLATYIIEGQTSKSFNKTKLLAFQHPEKFENFLNDLTKNVAQHLINQVKAGADVLQIFDSWAGAVPYNKFDQWVINPTKRIVELVKNEFPNTPIIGFPRGVGVNYSKYAMGTGVDGISLDELVDPQTVKFDNIVIQGGLDPNLLVAGGSELVNQVNFLKEFYQDKKYIFNLGHGILPNTPINHVEKLVELVRS